jgi:hypothetical protein
LSSPGPIVIYTTGFWARLLDKLVSNLLISPPHDAFQIQNVEEMVERDDKKSKNDAEGFKDLVKIAGAQVVIAQLRLSYINDNTLHMSQQTSFANARQLSWQCIFQSPSRFSILITFVVRRMLW